MATTLRILTSASEFVFVDNKILKDAEDVVASRMKDSCILEDKESDTVRHKSVVTNAFKTFYSLLVIR